VTKGWINIFQDCFHSFYFSQNIVSVIKTKHNEAASVKNAHITLVPKRERKITESSGM
jgi:hypothetical protein